MENMNQRGNHMQSDMGIKKRNARHTDKKIIRRSLKKHTHREHKPKNEERNKVDEQPFNNTY